MNARTLKEELLTLEARKEALEGTIGSQTDVEPLIHPKLAEVYRRKVADLRQALHEEAGRTEAFELIRSLIEEVRLVPQGRKLRVDICGELAGILNLCSDNKRTAAQIRDGSEQIKMVAGAGFEPATFRL